MLGGAVVCACMGETINTSQRLFSHFPKGKEMQMAFAEQELFFSITITITLAARSSLYFPLSLLLEQSERRGQLFHLGSLFSLFAYFASNICLRAQRIKKH
jgi:hypothetical protein